MYERFSTWAGLALVAAVGCSSSREAGPPSLAGSYGLPVGVERFAVGARGELFCSTAPRGMMEGPAAGNVLQVIESGGLLGDKVKLEPSSAEIKAIAGDGRGTLYLGVRDSGKDQVWILGEEARGEKVEPKAKLVPDLPGSLNSVFASPESGVFYVTCGDNWVVKMKADNSVVWKSELPGESRPEEGAADAAGNVYVRRTGSAIVKINPDGKLDAAWPKSEAGALTSVNGLAVDSRGIVYLASYDGDIRLRGYTPDGALAFNVVDKALDLAPERLVLGRGDRLYALMGQKMLVFAP